MAVTDSNKCYTFLCLGCDCLAQSTRTDAFTCSPRCRTKVHRSGRAKFCHAIAKSQKVSIGLMMQAAAINLALPERSKEIMSGKLTIDDVMPELNEIFRITLLKDLEKLRELKDNQ